jgi:hypothetical protein
MSAILRRLTPHPHRGDVIAAGAVPLTVAAFVIDLRMTQWSVGARFLVVAVIAVLILTMGWLAPLEADAPRPYHSMLLVAGLLTLVPGLVLGARLLGAAGSPGPGAIFWTFAAEALLAGAAARRANSGACTLIAAIAAIVSIEAFVYWCFRPHGPGTFRAVLLLLTFASVAGAVRLRDHHRRHAVQLVNAGGFAGLVLGVTYLFTLVFSSSITGGGFAAAPGHNAPLGWKLYLLALAFGLLAYAGGDREPGPAYLGVAVLVTFAVLTGAPTSSRGTLVGWPLILLVVGIVGLVVGLRPREPLPPAPESAGEADTIQLRHPGA